MILLPGRQVLVGPFTVTDFVGRCELDVDCGCDLLPGVNWVLTVAVILLPGVSLTPGFVARCELDIDWLWFCCQM